MVRRRLVGYYVVLVVTVVALYTVAYDAGMTVFEGRPRSLLHSLEVVLQTFTTTGYGQDAPWRSSEMKLFVVLMQVTGMALVFTALPVVVVPLLEEKLSRAPPTTAGDVADHVVVCGGATRCRLLADELAAADVGHVLVVDDRERAEELDADGYDVVHGDVTDESTLAAAGTADARAVVTDVADDLNLSVILAVREVAPSTDVYAVSDDPDFAKYQHHAGAVETFSPRTLLGEGLATKVTTAVTDETAAGLGVTDDLRVAELPIRPDGDLDGRRVEDADVEGRTGVRLIGAWVGGEFLTPPFPDLMLDEHAQLLVVGDQRQVGRLERLTGGRARHHDHGSILVLGYGVVGSTVAAALTDTGRSATVLDVEDGPAVDVVGDATDPSVLREAGLAEAGTVIVALDDDVTTLVTTFVIRDLDDDVEIIARADDPDSVKKLYRAGADYVMSLSRVSGRLLASAIRSPDSVMTYDNDIRIVDERASPLAGRTLGDVSLRERTGCTPVGIVRRDGRFERALSDWIELGEYDRLVVAGTDEDVEQFRTLLAAADEGGTARDAATTQDADVVGDSADPTVGTDATGGHGDPDATGG